MRALQLEAQITSAEILPQDDSADGQRVTVRFVIEAAAKNTEGVPAALVADGKAPGTLR